MVALVLVTVTPTGVETVVLPAESRATATRVWTPSAAVVVLQDTEYGADVSSAPRSAPSSRKRTPATPTSSVAVAASETVPVTVAPGSGCVIATTGGSASAAVVNVLSPETARLPAASRDRTR